MKFFLVLCTIFALTLAAPKAFRSDPEEVPSILQWENNNNGLGPYSFAYETSDGVQRQEQASFADPNDPNSPLIVTGSYSYPGTDGTVYTVNYVADENGYRIVESQPSLKAKLGNKRF